MLPHSANWLLQTPEFYAVFVAHDLITQFCVAMVLFNLAYMHWTLSRQLKLALDLQEDSEVAR